LSNIAAHSDKSHGPNIPPDAKPTILLHVKIRIVVLAFLTATLCLALDVPPRPSQWVTDSAGLLSPDQVAKLNARLERLEKQTHAQFIAYTMPSLGGEPLEDFTVRAAQAWGIGHKKKDNGWCSSSFETIARCASRLDMVWRGRSPMHIRVA